MNDHPKLESAERDQRPVWLLGKIYGSQSDEEKLLIVKLILCAVLCTLFSWLAGHPHSPTAAVTATLIVYSDRGFGNGVRYGMKRLVTQIIQGGFLLLVLLLFRRCSGEAFSEPVILILVIVIVLAVTLPINFRYSYAPLNCTLANATFVIATGLISESGYYLTRVLLCAAGAEIGYVIDAAITLPRDRYRSALACAKRCTESALLVSAQDKDLHSTYLKDKKQLERSISLMKAEQLKWLKKHRYPDDLIRQLQLADELLNILQAFREERMKSGRAAAKEFAARLDESLAEAYELNLSLLKPLPEEDAAQHLPEMEFGPIERKEEILLASWMIRYRRTVNELVDVRMRSKH